MTIIFSPFNPKRGPTEQIYLLTFLFKRQVIFTEAYMEKVKVLESETLPAIKIFFYTYSNEY